MNRARAASTPASRHLFQGAQPAVARSAIRGVPGRGTVLRTGARMLLDATTGLLRTQAMANRRAPVVAERMWS